MAVSDTERAQLVTYIEQRMCQEFRTGQQCKDGPKGARVVRSSPHPACEKAAEMIAIVERT
jgi:hypothetical protein